MKNATIFHLPNSPEFGNVSLRHRTVEPAPKVSLQKRDGEFRRPLGGLGFGTKAPVGAVTLPLSGPSLLRGFLLPMKIAAPNYTQVPNIILDSIAALEATEIAVVMVVCRMTFGWHKQKDKNKLSLTVLSKMTGLSRPTVIKAIGLLMQREWLTRVPDGRSFRYEIDLDMVKPVDHQSVNGVDRSETSDGKGHLPRSVKPVYHQSVNGVDRSGGHTVRTKKLETKKRVAQPLEAALAMPQCACNMPWPEGDPPDENIDDFLKATAPESSEPKPEKGITVGHAQFIARWTEAWLLKFGVKYAFAGGKDGKAVKLLLAGTQRAVEDLIGIAKAAWERVAEFPFDSALSIAGFNSRFNEIQAKLITTNGKTNGATNRPGVDRNAGTFNAGKAGQYSSVGRVGCVRTGRPAYVPQQT